MRSWKLERKTLTFENAAAATYAEAGGGGGEARKVGKDVRLAEHLIVSPNKSNEFNNAGAQMHDSIYHMTLKWHYIHDFYITMLL